MNTPKYKFPYEINLVEENLNKELLEYFEGERTGFVQVGPEKYFFPYKYKDEAESYYNFQARKSDIWILTFPRSGTTLTQELIWLVANNLDFEKARNKLLTERFPFFEFPLFVHPSVKEELLEENAGNTEMQQFINNISLPSYETLSQVDTSCRRFIKTHFPFSLLPPSVMKEKCKIIYVTRNPKDVAVSFYHLNRLFRTQGYNGDFKRYWGYFERGLNTCMPYYSHFKEALKYREHKNVLFLNYEDMKLDMNAVIHKVANFLECEISPEGVENLVNHLSINNFRKNPSVNGHEMEAAKILNSGEAGFVRNGGVADIQKEYADNPDLLARVNKWIEENEKQLADYNK